MGFMKKVKQAIVIRSDLGMGKGKLAAQVAHASLEAFEKTRKERPEWASLWEESGKAKIVLKVADRKELMELYKKVKVDLPAILIRDAGLTQVKPGTVTCFAVGPAPSEKIDRYLSHLKLL
jgi:PTH2 family peptidyl-tRNA hydrolase